MSDDTERDVWALRCSMDAVGEHWDFAACDIELLKGIQRDLNELMGSIERADAA